MTGRLSHLAMGAVLSLLLTEAAWADMYGFVDPQGVIHLANRKLDARYQLFKKGFIRPAQPLLPAPGEQPATLPMAQIPGSESYRVPMSQSRAASRWSDLIQQTASNFQLDPHLLHSIIAVESGYNPSALSPKGAVGLMQVMPATGLRFGVTNLSDPQQNLIAGARYLRTLQTQFNGNLPLVIAAYNAGEGAVQKYRNTIPPYSETRDYVAKVLGSYQRKSGGLPVQPPRAISSTTSSRSVLILRGDQPATVENW